MARVMGQADGKGGTLSGFGIYLGLAPQAFDAAPHHVHADPATRDIRYLLGGRKAGLEDQVVDFFVGQLLIRTNQAALHGFLMDFLPVQPFSIVFEFNDYIAPLVIGFQLDQAFAGFARGLAFLGGLDAVIHGVAHHMHER